MGGQHALRRLAELDWSPSDAAWRAVSVGSDECPGAERCPMGRECWAELARDRAQVADVVVVNTHLYGIDVGANGAIIPEHEVVVFDEAHGLEDIMSDTVGVEIAPGRFVTLGVVGARHPRRPGRDRLDRRPRLDVRARRSRRTPGNACGSRCPTT